MTKEVKRNIPKLRFPGFADDWEQRKFFEFAQRESTFRVSSSEYPSVEYEDVVSEEGRLNKNIRLKEIQKNGIAFDGTQVLYGKLRPYLHNWLNPDFTGVAVGDWWVLRPIGMDKKFLYRLIQTEQFDVVANQSSGSKMPRADWNLVSNTEFITPSSLDEQRQIAETFDSIDNLITLHQRKLDQIKEYKKGLLQKMFPNDGENVPEIRFPGFTGDWEQRKLGSLLEERHILSTITSEYPRLSFSIEEGVIAPEDRKTNKRDFLIKDEKNKKFLITEYNDIIYNPANVVFGAIHRNRYGKGCVSPIYKIFSTKQDPTFMGYIVRREEFISELSHKTEGTVIKLKTLKPEAFLDMKVIVPKNISEQIKIGKTLEQMDNLIALHQRKIEKMKEYKKGLLQQMFV